MFNCGCAIGRHGVVGYSSSGVAGALRQRVRARTNNGQQAMGNWQLATGNWQLATGNWQLAMDNGMSTINQLCI